jgi:hypothetical protein
MYGYFVLQLLDKYLNATKEPVLGALLDLVREKSLGEVLAGVQQEIFQALRSCETLKCMPDTTMDIKEVWNKYFGPFCCCCCCCCCVVAHGIFLFVSCIFLIHVTDFYFLLFVLRRLPSALRLSSVP